MRLSEKIGSMLIVILPDLTVVNDEILERFRLDPDY
jgi:hypothetical protein